MRLTKRKIEALVLSLVVMISFSSVGQVIHAATTITGYNLDSYMPYTGNNSSVFDFGKHFDAISAVMKAIGVFLFSVTRVIYSAFDTMIDKLLTVNILSDFAGTVGTIANTLYQNLFNSIGMMLFVGVVISIAFLMFKSPEQAFKQFFKVALVIILSLVWFKQSGFYLKAANNAITDLQDYATISVTKSADGNVTLAKNDKEANTKTDFKAQVRKTYFDNTIERPFYLMNYDSLDQKVITDDGKRQATALLSKDPSPSVAQKNGQEQADKFNKYKDLLPDKVTNYAVQEGFLTQKIGIALFSMVPALFYGILFTIIALIVVMLQLIVILLDLFMPVIAVISILPKYSNMLVSTIKSMATMILAQALFGGVMMVIQFVSFLSDKLIPVSNVGTYEANSLFTIIVIYVMWKFRKTIVNLVSKPISSSLGTAKTESKFAKDGVKKAGSLTKAAVIGAGAGALVGARTAGSHAKSALDVYNAGGSELETAKTALFGAKDPDKKTPVKDFARGLLHAKSIREANLKNDGVEEPEVKPDVEKPETTDIPPLKEDSKEKEDLKDSKLPLEKPTEPETSKEGDLERVATDKVQKTKQLKDLSTDDPIHKQPDISKVEHDDPQDNKVDEKLTDTNLTKSHSLLSYLKARPRRNVGEASMPPAQSSEEFYKELEDVRQG
ncbi:CD3337/EF1877 family mobilome membrane protein [Lapidilactobacillus mulanensis]|uniref:CD3337/EF1877 family mobilome membrane protein n=1 Tax=Lapidilactobacillus mulanensis TaxID=2485999 RepID=A0ABW4DM90_9LACO|nr:hypothetical protein [Lapidilactobacillus mulanensis]